MRLYLACLLTCCGSWSIHAQESATDRPSIPRIESIVVDVRQPYESHPRTIWFDDFDDADRRSPYPEQEGELTDIERFAATGRSLEMFYAEGRKGTGGRKVFFGDSPTYRQLVLRGDESFDDVYWRIYVKHPADWQGGGPAKLSRATSLVPPGWRQAMIAHVWSSGEALTLDPATGVRESEVVTTRYNDFPNLNWLGNRPASQFKLHGRDGLGWWVCVEARAKLNTPGKQDGLNQLWIDGQLEAERRDLDWRGTFTERGINAVFLEAYWNQGSPVDQARWIDNFVVSTQPIGPIVSSTNPELLKTTYIGPGELRAWQAELATAGQRVVVWRSQEIVDPLRVRVDRSQGQFTGGDDDRSQLDYDTSYVCRVRQQSSLGPWSAWSPWHQVFKTRGPEAETGSQN